MFMLRQSPLEYRDSSFSEIVAVAMNTDQTITEAIRPKYGSLASQMTHYLEGNSCIPERHL